MIGCECPIFFGNYSHVDPTVTHSSAVTQDLPRGRDPHMIWRGLMCPDSCGVFVSLAVLSVRIGVEEGGEGWGGYV